MATASVYRTHRSRSPLTLFLPIPLLTQQPLPLSSPETCPHPQLTWVSLPLRVPTRSPPHFPASLRVLPPRSPLSAVPWFVSHWPGLTPGPGEAPFLIFILTALPRVPSLRPPGGAPAWLPASHRATSRPFSSLSGAFSPPPPSSSGSSAHHSPSPSHPGPSPQPAGTSTPLPDCSLCGSPFPPSILPCPPPSSHFFRIVSLPLSLSPHSLSPSFSWGLPPAGSMVLPALTSLPSPPPAAHFSIRLHGLRPLS